MYVNLYKSLPSTILSLFFIVSCGGGGGGGGSSPLINTPSSPTYSYKTIQERVNEGSISEFGDTGRTLSYIYHSESGSTWSTSRTDNLNINFSQSVDSYGDDVVTISVNQVVNNIIPEGYTEALNYNLSYEISYRPEYDTFPLYDAPNHVYLQKFFSNGDLLGFGLADTESFAGTSYVDMFIWYLDYDSGDRDFGAIAFGDKTKSGDMPSSGSATYNVKTMGFEHYDGYIYNFHGDGQLVSNFTNMTISGTFNNYYVTDQPFSWSQIVGASAGSMSLTGDISGINFSGSVDWDNGYGSGSFEGSFFGPNAKEIGGSFYAGKENDAYRNNIIGSFIGTK